MTPSGAFLTPSGACVCSVTLNSTCLCYMTPNVTPNGAWFVLSDPKVVLVFISCRQDNFLCMLFDPK
uniref:Uncharacterized protein n=1 Tax=Arion vulgaris TaxID=1028688 RepID=A0A0B7BU77_9EUPU